MTDDDKTFGQRFVGWSKSNAWEFFASVASQFVTYKSWSTIDFFRTLLPLSSDLVRLGFGWALIHLLMTIGIIEGALVLQRRRPTQRLAACVMVIATIVGPAFVLLFYLNDFAWKNIRNETVRGYLSELGQPFTFGTFVASVGVAVYFGVKLARLKAQAKSQRAKRD